MRLAVESNTERRVLVCVRCGRTSGPPPALIVRGSSRRITIMRFRPANIRVINRRVNRLGRRPHCFPLARERQRKPKPRMYLTGSSISEPWFPRNRIACQVSRTDGRCHHQKMKPRERKSKPEQNLLSNREAYFQTVGWISRQKTSRLPAEGEVFLLTSPLIEPPISK